jgi:hypothetical protein
MIKLNKHQQTVEVEIKTAYALTESGDGWKPRRKASC